MKSKPIGSYTYPKTDGTGRIRCEFLFGAGIFCGSFMLGTNFTYRLMYLLLCIPQLQDWKNRGTAETDRGAAIAEVVLLAALGALWVNGNPIFQFFGQVVDWFLFGALAYVMALNFLSSVYRRSLHSMDRAG